ncbi:MAG: DUF4230 domain-containing protein [Agathobacter sp.]|nr:DUF4230 domain-containing protein [Agathobacter sp.]
MKNLGKKQMIIVGAIVVVVLMVVLILIVSLPKAGETEVITKSTLEKIVNISELSTYESIYNGIAVVYDEKKEDKIEYYVSYDATVKAGIDVKKIEYDVDNINKTIVVNMPEVMITDVTVEITSLDYIFVNDKANTSGVSDSAYKACIKDVEKESKEKDTILELAEESAKNIIKALINPFIEQWDAEYTLEIR